MGRTRRFRPGDMVWHDDRSLRSFFSFTRQLPRSDSRDLSFGALHRPNALVVAAATVTFSEGGELDIVMLLVPDVGPVWVYEIDMIRPRGETDG